MPDRRFRILIVEDDPVQTKLAMAVLANWFIIASQLGFVLGLLPWESAVRLGPEYAWTLTRLANGPMDVVHVLAAPLLAAWLAK